MHSKSKISELEITSLNKKGNGVGFLANPDGTKNSIEVPFAIPQDIVKVEIQRRRRNGFGTIQEIIKPSSLRQAPKCIHFGDCGGCRYQNISYAEQLKIKEEGILSLFKPLLQGLEDIRPIIPCENEWNYRNKMEFTFSEDLKGNKYLGLIKAFSKGRVVSLQECHLVNPWFVMALKNVRAWWETTELKAFSSTKGTGSLRTLTLREGVRTGDRMAILTVSGNPDHAIHKNDLERFVACLSKIFDFQTGLNLKSIFLRIQQTAKGSETNFFEIHLHGADHIRETLKIKLDANVRPQNFSFHISPTAFFQPNTLQAETLYEEAIRIAGITSETILYDLYCGTGTFGIMAARLARQVIGVEISPESVLDAKTNAEINNIENITFVTGAVRNVLIQVKDSKTLPMPDIVIVDPPRPGLDLEGIHCLIEMSPLKILYVSCNPVTQAENIQVFIENGYRIVTILPIDQFPHTPHVENVVLLQKVSYS